MRIGISVTSGLAGLLAGLGATAQPLGPGLQPPSSGPQAAGVLLVKPVVERVVDELPGGPLYWRVDSFPSLAEAQRMIGPHALAADAWGRSWRFTLGPPGGSSAGARKVAEIGPVRVPKASRYLLRVNRAGGPPGSSTPVHTHPGSEAFYVLTGELTQKSGHGAVRLEAGQAMNGHEPGMTMQLFSSGTGDLKQLVMFVVDADQPFSSPANFD